MQNRPRLKINVTKLDRLLEILGILLLLLLWASCFWAYKYLGSDQKIPIHFNLQGFPDKYGSKNSLLLLPIIGTALYIGISFLNRYPETFNYWRPITAENALSQYTMATKLLRLITIATLLVFLYIQTSIILAAKNIKAGLSSHTLLIVLLFMLIPTAWYLIQTIRKIK